MTQATPIGILNIDKPGGMTSHDVVNRVRRIVGIRRVGHAGTLDPLATGVLLVGVGQATRLIEYLVGQPKTYVTTIHLGQTTDTYDADGEVVAERPFLGTQADIENALSAFCGDIQQQPPMYSAIKRNGQPLYKLARQGVEVERPLRDVTIYKLALLNWQPPYLELSVTCSAGTYIRSIAHDLGEQLGCGGHVSTLRRTEIGVFTTATGVALTALNSDNWTQFLLPLDTAVHHLPQLHTTAVAAQDLQNGKWLPRQADHPQVPLVRVYNPDGAFIGIVAAHEDVWRPRKMFLQTNNN